jgi:hypothetical protein
MCGGLLDTGSEAGMTEKAVMQTPAQQRRPSHHELARHPGRDSEPGSSYSVECLTSGRYSMYGGLLDTGSEAGMTTKTHDEQKVLHNFRHPRCTLHTSIPKVPSTLCHPRRVLHTPSSRTRQRAGIQLLGGMSYLRQIVKVGRFTGYRLGGRYDRKSSDANSCATTTPFSPRTRPSSRTR